MRSDANFIKNGLAFFAGGCFWGVEHLFSLHKGVLSAVSGYMGGELLNPSYEAVCTGGTGHAEVVRVEFDPSTVSFEDLARFFFEIHDPEQLDRQGPDVGSQYRSAIFYVDQGQKKTAEKLMLELRQNGYRPVTEVAPACRFYPAEEYHQRFFAKHPQQGGCHFHVPRFSQSDHAG